MNAITATLVYKLVVLLCGLGFSYLGFRLFLSGVFAPGGDMDARFGKNRLVLKQAAPGIFYACFGTVIILAAVWKGLVLEDPSSKTVAPQITIGVPISFDDQAAASEIVSAISDGKKIDPAFESTAMSLLTRIINHRGNVTVVNASTVTQTTQGGRGIASEGEPEQVSQGPTNR